MMELKTVKMAWLKPYANNPRDNEAAVADVMESVRQCGYIAPIVVNENGEILAGHTRYKALTQLEWDSVEVLIVPGLTEEQQKKFRILDNRCSELAYWDYDKLLQELEGLDFEDYPFGFEKLMDKMEQDISSGFEFDMGDFDDEQFAHTCPECGFRFN